MVQLSCKLPKIMEQIMELLWNIQGKKDDLLCIYVFHKGLKIKKSLISEGLSADRTGLRAFFYFFDYQIFIMPFK